MDTNIVLQRLRIFLLLLAGAMCLGSILELWFAKHTEDPIQLLPFVACGMGFVAVLLALLRPQPWTLRLLRGVMLILIATSLFGIFEHVQGNIAFKLEIRPGATIGDVWFEALRGGNPILAPGILALISMLAIAATYAHPALDGKGPG